MFYGQRSKVLPHFTGYLAQRSTELPRHSEAASMVIGCVGSPLIGLAAATIAGSVSGSWVVAFFAGVLGFFATLATALILNARPRLARNPREAQLLALGHALARYQPSLERKRLHRELDPTASQLLEAGAYYWQKIRHHLDGPYWTALGEGDSLRTRAREAADQAMDELAALLSPCIGTPAKSPGDDVWSIFEDFKDGDIDDALKGLKNLAKGKSGDYAHRSPHIGPLFEPAKQLAEQLKLLSVEVEQMTARAVRETQTRSAVGSTDQIYTLLSEMQARRVAEAELDQGDTPHLRH